MGGALAPGSRADLYASGDTSTTAVARDVLVLATSAGGADGAVTADVTWVTVAVEPESVQEVIAASRKAELYFALPASGDAVGGGGAVGLALGSTVGSDASREGSR